MSKTNAFETAWHSYVFADADLAGIGDATGLLDDPTSPGTLQIALYTVDPTDSTPGTEITTGQYTDYARVTVARSTAGWTVSGNQVSNNAAITFPISGGGTGCTATAVGILATAGYTLLYWKGLDANLPITTGVTPQFLANQLIITED